MTFRETADMMHGETALMGQLLDLHLSRNIARLSARKEPEMRGLQRLANVMQNGLQDLDTEAGAVADEFVAAQAESKVVIAGFRQHVGEIRASTAEVRNFLNQMTNTPPLSESGSSTV